MNPIPGEWNVKAESDSAHSIRLTALSDVVFNFGFSLKPPNRISETLFNPLLGSIFNRRWLAFKYIIFKGEKNILSIAPSNATMLNNLTSAKISLYNDKMDNQTAISFELDLTRIANEDDESGDIYVTQSFEPPRQPFKIDVSTE